MGRSRLGAPRIREPLKILALPVTRADPWIELPGDIDVVLEELIEQETREWWDKTEVIPKGEE